MAEVTIVIRDGEDGQLDFSGTFDPKFPSLEELRSGAGTPAQVIGMLMMTNLKQLLEDGGAVATVSVS